MVLRCLLTGCVPVQSNELKNPRVENDGLNFNLYNPKCVLVQFNWIFSPCPIALDSNPVFLYFILTNNKKTNHLKIVNRTQ